MINGVEKIQLILENSNMNKESFFNVIVLNNTSKVKII